MRRTALTLCVVAFLWANAAVAGLVTISSTGFSISQAGLISLAPFDPALGTLDSVNVTINGQITVTGSTAPLFGGQGQPQPYPYQVNVTQDFDGLGGQFFAFNPALFSLQAFALGVGEPFTLVTAFSYGFTFDSTTDLSGGFVVPSFSGPIAPPLVSGTRANFLETLGGINQILLSLSATPVGPVAPSLTTASGALIVQYNYTPAPTGSVDEPQTLALLALAGLGLRRRLLKKTFGLPRS